MTNANLTKADLKVKLNKVVSQINYYQSQTGTLQKEREALTYLLNNFSSIAGGFSIKSGQVRSLLSELEYSPTLHTKDLIIKILEKEGRHMKSPDIYEIFHKVKPGIKRSTFYVSLSQMISERSKYKVVLQKHDKNYKNYKYAYVVE